MQPLSLSLMLALRIDCRFALCKTAQQISTMAAVRVAPMHAYHVSVDCSCSNIACRIGLVEDSIC
jgi:hypothetical protein